MSHDDTNYPPSPALMLSKGLDFFCDYSPLQCQEWRDSVPFGWADQPHGWLSYRVGDVTDYFPPTLSYSNFLESTGAEHSLDSVWTYAFETPSTDLSVVTTPVALWVLLFLVLTLRATKAVLLPFFSGIGRKAGRHTHGVEWEKKNEERIVKFGEYVFRLLYHTFVSACGIWYFWDKEWWDKSRGGTTTLFANYPFHEVAVGMTWYYLVQCAYNLEALLSLAELSFTIKFQNPMQKEGLVFPIKIGWSKTVRGDFREMAVHHIVTNLLVIGSSFFRLTRIGSMVFLVHDISDVPVDVSKLANFLKWKKSTIAGFVSMVLMWLVFRLGIFPFVIYKSVLTESWMVTENLDPIFYYCYRHFFYYLVGQIILLHVLWFFMFLKMGWLLVRKGERHDLSEHKGGEEQAAIPTNGSSSNGASSNGYHGNGAVNGSNGHATNGKKQS